MTSREVLGCSAIVPVIAINNENDALELAYALLEGGIRIMEITLRTPNALECIKKITKELPQMNAGAGTVTNSIEFQKAVDAGAKFVFSPGISTELMHCSKTANIAFIPGVATASEVMLAQNHGFYDCKLFPATAVGGIELLKAFYGPFGRMMFCPTGGITLENAQSFLTLPNVLCVGGSWIVPKEAIETKNFEAISKLCKEAIKTLH